jgi:hypothetical protein
LDRIEGTDSSEVIMAFKLSFRGGKQVSSGDGVVGGETVTIEPHMRAMIDGDGGVLLDLKAGRYYSLNSVGAKIWTRAEKGAAHQGVSWSSGNTGRERLRAGPEEQLGPRRRFV